MSSEIQSDPVVLHIDIILYFNSVIPFVAFISIHGLF